MTNTYKLALVILCAIIGTLFGQFSLFIPVLSEFDHLHMLIKLMISIFLTLIQLGFMVYYVNFGIKIMNPISLVMLVFIITFILQLITNVYIYGNKNTLDDYVGMVIMIIGIFVSKTQVFN
jgi:drug/metabolite transporter (DMT)-like permease